MSPSAPSGTFPRRYLIAATLLLIAAVAAVAAGIDVVARPLRVAVIGNVPPLSYVDERGRPSGFAVELAEALCEVMKTRCTIHVVLLDEAIDALAADRYDFASINLLATPERRERVLFSKPFYRSVSVWLARPSVVSGTHGLTVAAVRGSAQADYIEKQGWKHHFVDTHQDLTTAIANGAADAAIVPMTTSVILVGDPRFKALGLQPTVMSDPALGGDVCISISPKRKDLPARLDAALDQLKNDGRFDRINSKYLPFKLQ